MNKSFVNVTVGTSYRTVIIKVSLLVRNKSHTLAHESLCKCFRGRLLYFSVCFHIKQAPDIRHCRTTIAKAQNGGLYWKVHTCEQYWKEGCVESAPVELNIYTNPKPQTSYISKFVFTNNTPRLIWVSSNWRWQQGSDNFQQLTWHIWTSLKPQDECPSITCEGHAVAHVMLIISLLFYDLNQQITPSELRRKHNDQQ